jgi:hypothetical protein
MYAFLSVKISYDDVLNTEIQIHSPHMCLGPFRCNSWLGHMGYHQIGVIWILVYTTISSAYITWYYTYMKTQTPVTSVRAINGGMRGELLAFLEKAKGGHQMRVNYTDFRSMHSVKKR